MRASAFQRTRRRGRFLLRYPQRVATMRAVAFADIGDGIAVRTGHHGTTTPAMTAGRGGHASHLSKVRHCEQAIMTGRFERDRSSPAGPISPNVSVSTIFFHNESDALVERNSAPREGAFPPLKIDDQPLALLKPARFRRGTLIGDRASRVFTPQTCR